MSERELQLTPAAWMRGVCQPSTIHGPAEYDDQFASGDDRPDGEGWVPLYTTPLPPIRVGIDVVEHLVAWLEYLVEVKTLHAQTSDRDTWIESVEACTKARESLLAAVRLIAGKVGATDIDAMATRLRNFYGDPDAFNEAAEALAYAFGVLPTTTKLDPRASGLDLAAEIAEHLRKQILRLVQDTDSVVRQRNLTERANGVKQVFDAILEERASILSDL